MIHSVRLHPLALLLLLFPCAVLSGASDQKSDGKQNSGKPSRLQVDSGTLFTSSGIPVALRRVLATIQKRSNQNSKDGADPDGSENASEVVTIDSGRVVLTDTSLTRLMNQKIGQDGKVHDLKVTSEKGQLKITGKAKKTIAVPFTLEGPLKPTADGQVELQANEVKAVDIPGLAQLLGFNVQKAVGTNAAKGVHAQKNTIIFNPDKLWGLPIHGKVTGVDVQQNRVVLTFGNQQKEPNGNPKVHLARKPAKPGE